MDYYTAVALYMGMVVCVLVTYLIYRYYMRKLDHKTEIEKMRHTDTILASDGGEDEDYTPSETELNTGKY